MTKFTTKMAAVAIGASVLFSGIGQVSAATYTVQKGDTLFKIGQAHKVSYQTIMQANKLTSTNIKVGQKLQIGATTSVAASTQSVSKPAASTAVKPATAAKPAATSTYVVKKGDSLSKIASSYGVTYQTLMSWNGLKSTNIRVGQKLSVQGKAATTTATTATKQAAQPVAKPTAAASNVISIARQYLGVKYRFGGTNPSTGFDCSGYVSYVMIKAGKMKSRTNAAGLYSMSKKVSTPQIGDLVFFSGTYKRGISHVGIYIGNNQMMDASGSRVQITNIYNSYWKKYFTGFGRI